MTDISAIGNYGALGAAGLYGSYYDPSMMSLMNGYGGYNGYTGYTGYTGYGMTNPLLGSTMGMYSPSFMAQQLTDYMEQMNSAQNRIQQMNIQNQVDLHNAKEQAEVSNLRSHDNAFFDTSMVNGDIQNYIKDIYVNIREGKMDYVAHRYFELRQAILNKYGDRFTENSSDLNNKANIDHFIQTKYSEIGAGLSGDGIKPDLKTDILKYGENAFQHGFNTTFMGNKDHTKSTAEETLYKMYGTPIEDKSSKEKAHAAGSITARVAEVGAAGVVGAGIGATALGVAKLLGNKIGPLTTNIAKTCRNLPSWLKVGGLALAAADIVWQCSRD